jgi:hypothetical protein
MTTINYPPLPEAHFRVLSLTSINGEPHRILQIFPISEPLEYDALSYCWGQEDTIEMFLCGDEQTIPVSPHLFTAL